MVVSVRNAIIAAAVFIFCSVFVVVAVVCCCFEVAFLLLIFIFCFSNAFSAIDFFGWMTNTVVQYFVGVILLIPTEHWQLATSSSHGYFFGILDTYWHIDQRRMSTRSVPTGWCGSAIGKQHAMIIRLHIHF